MVNWSELIENIRSDRESGSKELALRSIEFAIRVLRGGTARDLDKYLESLKSARPGFIVLENLADIIKRASSKMEKLRLLDFLNGLKLRIVKAQREINLFFSEEATDYKSFLTISKSSTVIDALSYIGGMRGITVYVMESRPLGEGAITANILKQAGCRTILIPDATISSIISNVDSVVVGADAVTRRGFYNKVGTLLLALLARERDTPLYVLTDTLKLTERDKITSEEIEFETSFGERIRLPLLEMVPNRLVYKFITERGISKDPFVNKIV